MKITVLHTADALGPPLDAVLDQLSGALGRLGHDADRLVGDQDVAPLGTRAGSRRPPLGRSIGRPYVTAPKLTPVSYVPGPSLPGRAPEIAKFERRLATFLVNRTAVYSGAATEFGRLDKQYRCRAGGAASPPARRGDTPPRLQPSAVGPNLRWTQPSSSQPATPACLEDCARRFGIEDHTRTGVAIESAEWSEAAGRWEIETGAGGLSARSPRDMSCAVGST